MDPFSITSLASELITNSLIDSFNTLRKGKKKDELESDEWKNLESAYLQHLRWRFEYPKKVFGQQQVTSIVISVVVLILILSGLLFSFWQLEYALKIGNIKELQTDLTIETAGKISISSSIIGAVVLVISLAFFSLYLKNVFKIQHPNPPQVEFGGTDIAEAIKSKLFQSKSQFKEEDIYKKLEELLNKMGDKSKN